MAGVFADLPYHSTPENLPLVLASGSPRRAELLRAAGYSFEIRPADPNVECGVCSRKTPPELVAQYAFRKAADVVRHQPLALILAADTVGAFNGQALGKPVDRQHAREMLQLLRGQVHHVFTGICLWHAPRAVCTVEVVGTRLFLDNVADDALESYLDTNLWEGKAGAFGYQDGVDWLQVLEGSESNVVGLPMERLAEMLRDFDRLAIPIDQAAL